MPPGGRRTSGQIQPLGLLSGVRVTRPSFTTMATQKRVLLLVFNGSLPTAEVWHREPSLIGAIRRAISGKSGCLRRPCEDEPMPWRPTFDDSDDPQLDPFRERAGRLTDDEGMQGWVYVRPWVIADRVGGHLWWQRWGPQYEVSAGYVRMDGDGDPSDGDWVSRRADVAEEVRDWAAGRFIWNARNFKVSWVDAEESRHIRDEVFELGDPQH